MLIQTTKVADTCFRQVSYPFAQGSLVFRDRLADYLSLIWTILMSMPEVFNKALGRQYYASPISGLSVKLAFQELNVSGRFSMALVERVVLYQRYAEKA